MQAKKPTGMVVFILFGILYMILSQVMYIYIYQKWIYYGFEYNFSIYRCIIAYALAVIIFFVVYRYWNDKSFSKMTLSFIFLANVIPSLLLYIYMPGDFFLMLAAFYIFLLLFESIIPVIQFKVFKKTPKFNLDLIINIAFIIIAILILYIWIRYAHFHLQWNIFDVYDTRLDARFYSMPTVLTYLYDIAMSFNSFIVVIYLYRKKYIFFIMSLVIHFLIFSISANKTTLFIIIFGIAFYFIIKYRKGLIKYLPPIIAAGGVIGLLEKIILNSQVIIDTFFRRIMFLPALLNYQYYEYFSENGIDFYRQSLGRIFGTQSQYSSSLPYVIGSQYYTSSTSANNGLFSDAYANLGVVGMIVMPLLLILVLKIADGGTTNIPMEIWSVCALQFYFTFTSSGFFTALLTHGVILIILFFYFMNGNMKTIKVKDSS